MKCCDIIAGHLRRTISIERATRTRNTSGGFDKLWASHVQNVRAKVVNLSGRERWAADRINAEVSKRFTIRYRADILESDSIIFEGKRHNIKFIDNVEYLNRWLVIDADSGVPV